MGRENKFYVSTGLECVKLGRGNIGRDLCYFKDISVPGWSLGHRAPCQKRVVGPAAISALCTSGLRTTPRERLPWKLAVGLTGDRAAYINNLAAMGEVYGGFIPKYGP